MSMPDCSLPSLSPTPMLPRPVDPSRLPERAVLVTGLGTVNPLAMDVGSTWQALLTGETAVRPLAEFLTDIDDELPVTLGAGIELPSPKDLGFSAGRLRRLDRASVLALLAAREAHEDALAAANSAEASGDSCEHGQPQQEAGTPPFSSETSLCDDPEAVAVCCSPGMGMVLTVMSAWDTMRERGARAILPTTIPALMPNAPAATLGLQFGAQGGVHSPVSACASGAESIAQAADLIAVGRAEVVYAGGTDACLHPMPLAAFRSMHALSPETDAETASRPFGPDRSGFVMGEGAGVLVLESAAHAAARGAQAYAVLAGSMVTSDAHDLVRPEAEGRQQGRALRGALRRAEVSPQQLAHINAHATSTPAGDIIEASMIAREAPQAVVSATKGATGHLLGGAGAVEAIITVASLAARVAPPTRAARGLDPEIAQLGLDVTLNEPRDLPEMTVAASTSFGFGGHNVALVFTRG